MSVVLKSFLFCLFKPRLPAGLQPSNVNLSSCFSALQGITHLCLSMTSQFQVPRSKRYIETKLPIPTLLNASYTAIYVKLVKLRGDRPEA